MAQGFTGATTSAITAASTTEVLTGTDASKYVTPDALAALWEQGSDIASAGTISVGEGGYFNVTGTTTITDVDFGTTKAGRLAWLKFAGALTLTHNATTLILPTGANITTAAGDVAAFVSEGGDNVRCVAYLRADGTALTGGGGFTAASTTETLTGTETAKGVTPDSLAALWEQGSDVASAGTISLGEGGYFNVTGTTAITDIDFGTTKAGRLAWLKFAGALTLTHNATTLILPTGANITTAAGDVAAFVSEGGDNVRCVAYLRYTGRAITNPISADGSWAFAGVNTQIVSAGTTDDWNPTSLSDTSWLRVTCDGGNVTLTGIAGGASGRILVIHNLDPHGDTITLSNENASSTAANRFDNGADITISAKQGVILQYDSTSSRWRAIARPSSGGGGLSGSTGSTDNALLRADGTGGSTVQGSGTTAALDDNGLLTLTGASAGLKLATAGAGISVKEGSNATCGVATLSAGSATVSTTKVTANSRIFLTPQTMGGFSAIKCAISARTAGTSFVITADDTMSTDSVAWLIVEPA